MPLIPNVVHALAAAGDAMCYAATDAGLWRWQADAHSGRWTRMAPQFGAVELLSVAAAGDTIWIGARGDIAVSRDGGETWGIASLPVKADVIALAASPDNAHDGIVLAATLRDGVLRSTDGGATFHAWNFGLLELTVNAIALSPSFAVDSHALAATDYAVYVSRNGGRAWRELTLPADLGPFTAVGFDGSDTLIGTELCGLWRLRGTEGEAVRETTGRTTSINAIADGIVATASSVLQYDSRRWAKVGALAGAQCVARCGDRVLASGEKPGVFVAWCLANTAKQRRVTSDTPRTNI
jgi:hypothetical protein